MKDRDAMRITLVGMSGSGKSYWSRKLTASGFKLLACDDLIASRLFPNRRTSEDAVDFLGGWMGFPYQPGYAEREAAYSNAEIEILSAVVDYLSNPAGTGDEVVVDTTGSVVYSGESILNELRRLTTIVHLSTPAKIQGKMLEAYLANPRPVLWKGLYQKETGETDAQALARCYSILLATREQLYGELAHLSIDYQLRTRSDFGVSEFLSVLSDRNRVWSHE